MWRRILFVCMTLRLPGATLFPYTTLFRSVVSGRNVVGDVDGDRSGDGVPVGVVRGVGERLDTIDRVGAVVGTDRKSTRLKCSDSQTSYAVLCVNINSRDRLRSVARRSDNR